MAENSAKNRTAGRAGGRAYSEAPEKSVWREYAEALGMAVLLALFIRTFIVQAFKIPSGSMLPTLEIGDHLLVNKLSYGVRIPFLEKRYLAIWEPEREDIIVFVYPKDPSKDFIKRVQAVAGQTVEIRNKALYIDGEMVPDEFAYIAPGSSVFPKSKRDNFGPFTVPDGEVFVMGDNRDHSHDSRFWGTVPIDDIRGRAFILYWSWDSENFRPRWSRIGDIIH